MEPLDVLANVGLFALFMFLLDRSSMAVIVGAEEVSASTGMSRSSVGFIFVALLTSLPEAVVSLYATVEHAAGLAVGNVLGSNIANVCLVLGLPIIYGCAVKGARPCSLRMESRELSTIFFGLFISSVLPLALIRGAKYGMPVGLMLVALFFVYNYRLTKSRIQVEQPENTQTKDSRASTLRGAFLMSAGVAGVVISGYVIVYSALNIASALLIPEAFIGVTVVALGTSLPEMAISLKSMLRGRMDFALANAVGSNFANLTIILGLVFIFSGMTVKIDAYFDMVFFSLISNLFFWYFLSRNRLGAKEGLMLILIYAVFITDLVGAFAFF